MARFTIGIRRPISRHGTNQSRRYALLSEHFLQVVPVTPAPPPTPPPPTIQPRLPATPPTGPRPPRFDCHSAYIFFLQRSSSHSRWSSSWSSTRHCFHRRAPSCWPCLHAALFH